MNKEILEGKWYQLKGSVKQKWGKLTDDDIDEIDGSMDRLAGKLEERYGKHREAVEKEIESWQVNP